ncbi:MAG TPA: glycosyltransferase family 9 protein [Gemmatimonadota bacterium]|jgi:heptosyltransferase-2|nr:glycosyltransferase family 9 protein [Gemmatimonadota bacterium]
MRFEGIVQPPPGVRPAEPSADGTVVIRAPNWIGDAVLALPAVAAVADRFADRTVLVLARGTVAPLFVGLPRIDSVLRVAEGGADRVASVRRALEGEEPELGIVFPHSFGTAVELAAAGTRTIWGYGGPLRKLVLDVALPPRWLAGRHRWEAYALLAAAVTGRAVVERYPLARGPGDVAAADALFAEAGLRRGTGEGPLVGLVPGAHADSRRWPAARFAELASRLGHRGARVVLFGSAAERPLAARVAAAADPAPADLSGRTPLPVLAECFRRLDFLVTNDTGPMHLAAALGTPLLDLCGAANEVVTGPRGAASEVVVHPIYCRPCVKNSCAYNLGCMKGIGVDRVEALVRARIDQPVPAAIDG